MWFARAMHVCGNRGLRNVHVDRVIPPFSIDTAAIDDSAPARIICDYGAGLGGKRIAIEIVEAANVRVPGLVLQ